MYFTAAAAEHLKCSCKATSALTDTKTAAVPTVRSAIPVTFTVRTGSINSACMRSVRIRICEGLRLRGLSLLDLLTKKLRRIHYE